MTRSPATSLNSVLRRLRPSSVRELSEPVYSLRARSASISFWIISGALAVAAISAIAGGQLASMLFSVPGAALFIWLLAVLLLIPGVYYDADRVVVVNFARIHVLPWSSVSRVDQGIDLLFTLNDGRKIHAYGSPYPRRKANMAPTRKSLSSGRNYDGDTSILEGFRAGARERGEVASHTWNVPLLLTGTFLLLLFIGASIAARMLTA